MTNESRDVCRIQIASAERAGPKPARLTLVYGTLTQ